MRGVREVKTTRERALTFKSRRRTRWSSDPFPYEGVSVRLISEGHWRNDERKEREDGWEPPTQPG